MLDLWEWMTQAYLNKWTTRAGEMPSKAWFDALYEIDSNLINLGIQRLIDEKWAWPPSLPEFLALCSIKPEEVGAKPVDEAYIEAVNRGDDVLQLCQNGQYITVGKQWSSAAVLHTFKSIKDFLFYTDPQKQRAAFEKKYTEIIGRIASGEKFDFPNEVVLSLKNESNTKTESNVEAARSILDKLKSSFK